MLEELKSKKQWVNVKDKLSLDPKDLSFANLSKEETWGTYEQVKENDKPIGFVFSITDNIVGIDIDSGIYEENGIMNDFGVEIINLLSSYTEWSSSKRGVHIFIKADLDFEAIKTFDFDKKCEIYNYRRMFLMTDNILINSNIEYRQKEIEYLISKYFLEGLKHAEVVEDRTDLIDKYYKKDLPPMEYTTIRDRMREETLKSICYKYLLQNKSKHFILNEMKKANKKCVPMLNKEQIRDIYKKVISII